MFTTFQVKNLRLLASYYSQSKNADTVKYTISDVFENPTASHPLAWPSR